MVLPKSAQVSDGLFGEGQAARFLNLSVRTLQAWRTRGEGPAYVRAGRAIRYRQQDILAWIQANTIPAKSPPSIAPAAL